MRPLNRLNPTQVREAYRSFETADSYAEKHRRTAFKRLAARWEAHLVQRALADAGARGPVLDSPCGTGRFLPVLTKIGSTTALDASDAMVSRSRQELGDLAGAVHFLKAAFPHLPFQRDAFGSAVCLRYLHHLHTDVDLLAALTELRRVTRGPVVVSLFLSGNLQSIRRRRKDLARGQARRFILKRNRLHWLAGSAGFEVSRCRSIFPGVSALHVVTLLPGKEDTTSDRSCPVSSRAP